MKGSLQRVKNVKGEWVWRGQWREDGRGRTRLLGACREMRRKTARALLNEIVRPLAIRKTPLPGITVASYVHNDYLTTRSAAWKLSTEASQTALIERYILPEIGSLPLPFVTRMQLQSMLGKLQAANLSRQTISHVRLQLKAIFEMAAGDGRIVINPALGLVTPRDAAERQAPEIGDADQITKALLTLDTRDRLFVMLAVRRGMRPGEISALQLRDIHEGVIHVTRRVYMGVIDTPKTWKGKRDIPVGNLQELIDAQIATLPDSGPQGWLFPSETGKTPIAYKSLYQRRLQPALEAAGLKNFNYQAMRATWSTMFAEVEPDVKVRADIAGHSPDVQEQVYRQTTKEQRKRSIDKLDQGRVQ